VGTLLRLAEQVGGPSIEEAAWDPADPAAVAAAYARFARLKRAGCSFVAIRAGVGRYVRRFDKRADQIVAVPPP
jgi:hypothetical protein